MKINFDTPVNPSPDSADFVTAVSSSSGVSPSVSVKYTRESTI